MDGEIPWVCNVSVQVLLFAPILILFIIVPYNFSASMSTAKMQTNTVWCCCPTMSNSREGTVDCGRQR